MLGHLTRLIEFLFSTDSPLGFFLVWLASVFVLACTIVYVWNKLLERSEEARHIGKVGEHN